MKRTFDELCPYCTLILSVLHNATTNFVGAPGETNLGYLQIINIFKSRTSL